MRRLTVILTAFWLALATSLASAATYVPSDEAHMERTVNATRVARGLKPLRVLDALVQLARKHSVEMNQQQKLFHNLNLGDDIRALGLHPSWHGENAVVAPDIYVAEAAFAGSPLHLENILRPSYNAFGVGVVPDADGVIWVTQVFAEIRGLTTQVAAVVQAPVAHTAPPTQPPAPKPTPKKVIPEATKKPAPVPATPKPAAPLAIERGVVAPQLPVKAKTHGWGDYLPATALMAIFLAPTLMRWRPPSLTTDADSPR